jgi:hypothetical protein
MAFFERFVKKGAFFENSSKTLFFSAPTSDGAGLNKISSLQILQKNEV